MNSVSHQQRMMEIQHMSNACLVTLLPRVQESLQGTSKDGSVKDHVNEGKSPFVRLKCQHGHAKYDFFVLIPERKEKSKSTGVPPVRPTSPAASQSTVVQRSTK